MRKFVRLIALLSSALTFSVLTALTAHAERVGCVSTAFKLVGPNHRVCVEAFDDPEVEGVTCHLSRAITGGISGGLGLAEDPSLASIACRQVGPIKITGKLKDGETVFRERLSPVFKNLRVARFVDKQRDVLIYLVYSRRLVDGSYKSSISTVPLFSEGREIQGLLSSAEPTE